MNNYEYKMYENRLKRFINAVAPIYKLKGFDGCEFQGVLEYIFSEFIDIKNDIQDNQKQIEDLKYRVDQLEKEKL